MLSPECKPGSGRKWSKLKDASPKTYSLKYHPHDKDVQGRGYVWEYDKTREIVELVEKCKSEQESEPSKRSFQVVRLTMSVSQWGTYWQNRRRQNLGIAKIGLTPPSAPQFWQTGGFDDKKCVNKTHDSQ